MITSLFTGRLTRLQYIVGLIYYIVAATIVAFIWVFFGSLLMAAISAPQQTIPPLAWTAAIIYLVILVIGYISLSARRLHDLNRSGSLLWWAIIPLFGQLITLYLLIAPSVATTNQYGSVRRGWNFWYIAGLK